MSTETQMTAERSKKADRKSRMGETMRRADKESGRKEREGAIPARRDHRLSLAALTGSALLWASFPPCGVDLLVFFAPVAWIWIAQRPELPGNRPYLTLWFFGFIYWLVLIQGIRLAHPALYAGWIALSAYVALQFPVFVWLTRRAKSQWGVPTYIAAPLAWITVEYLRGTVLLGGFTLGLLGNALVNRPLLIQVADLFGGYGVSLVVITVATAIAHMIELAGRTARSSERWIASGLGCAALLLACAYGFVRLGERPLRPLLDDESPNAAKVVLIQGARDTIFEFSEERNRQTLRHYFDGTAALTPAFDEADLVVWPESSFPPGWMEIEEPFTKAPSAEMSIAEYREAIENHNRQVSRTMAGAIDPKRIGYSTKRLLVGSSKIVYTDGPQPKFHNSALLFNERGELLANYHKNDLVMFGEYIPIANWFPILYRITPMPAGVTPGKGATAIEAGRYIFSPSICFETTIPGVIRRHILELRRAGKEPDFLVNTTNDGWFWGSSILDLHFQCAVMRAVENRKPLLIAANTGISAVVDGNGRVLSRLEKRKQDSIQTQIAPDGRITLFQTIGDSMPLAALCLTLLFAFTGRKRGQQAGKPRINGR